MIDFKLANQLSKNLISNLIYFFVNIIIGLLLVPFFIDTLGVAAYGLIPLATSITGYVVIVVQSLNMSVSRYLTIDLQRGDYVAANKTYNTSIFGISMIILLMIPIMMVVAFFLPSIFHIPSSYESDATFLFLGVCGALLVRTLNGNFTVQLFAYNRLDLQNIVNLTNLILQTGMIFLFFAFIGPNLTFVGISYFTGAVGASLVSIFFARKVCPYLHISIHDFDRKRVREICSMGLWVVVNQIGSLLFLQIDLIVVNMFYGAESAGEYAIALQWVILLRSVAHVISGIITPTIFSYYALKKSEDMIQVSKYTVKIMGMFMAIPIGLICGFSSQILLFWVGEKFIFLGTLLTIMTIHLAINLSVFPLFSINVAYNQVQVPGIVTFFMGLGNFVLAILFSSFNFFGYYGIAIAGAIVLTTKNAIFTPWYATRVLSIRANTFTRAIYPGLIGTFFFIISAFGLKIIFSFNSIISLGSVMLILSFLYLLLLWRFGFSAQEKNFLVNFFKHNLRRI